MRSLATDEVSRMTVVQVSSMNDLCTLYHATRGQDSFGQLIDSYDSGTFNVACGLFIGNEFINERGQVISIDADAVLRLPDSVSISVKDKVVARGKTFIVDGVFPGRNITTIKLMEFTL